MTSRLKDKVALVTAAGQGIGKATAIAFHNEGAKVIATDINDKTLNELNKEYPKIEIKNLDSTNKDAIKNYVNTLSKITESNKQKLDELILGISNMDKKLSNFNAIKGNDDILTLAIELVRSGSSKEEIKSKTGLNESEIETIYAYHKNVKN